MKYLLILFWCVCIFYGCEREKQQIAGVEVRIRVVVLEDHVEIPVVGAMVEWTNLGSGTVYRAVADKAGMAVCMVEIGNYRVAGNHRRVIADDNREIVFSGGLQQVSVNGMAVNEFVLWLEPIALSRLVIKEIYYGGCRTDEGNPYQLDGYISLYNNSADTLWMDGICIGLAAPVRANRLSGWLKNDPELSELPISQFGWRFPGEGHECALAPGTETVVAINAVDHRNAYGHSQSVNLSGADWAFYRDDFNPEFSAITPGVKRLELFWLAWEGLAAPSFVITADGPGLVVFRMEGDAYEYEREHLRYEPEKREIPAYMGMVIPRKWILDYVECVGGVMYHKRVPAALDLSAVWLSAGAYSGKAFRRKVIGNIGTRMVYQDTNDSANDFEESVPEFRIKAAENR